MPTPEAVGKRRQHQCAEREPDRAGTEDRAEGADGHSELARDCGSDEGDRLSVEAVEQRDQAAQNENTDLETAEPSLIDDIRNVDRSPRHQPLPVWKSFSTCAARTQTNQGKRVWR